MESVQCGIHKLVADVCLIAKENILFVKYEDTTSYDDETGWFLPDDTLKHGEHPDDAVMRILSEQVQIAGKEPKLSFIESFGEQAWHLIFHYSLELDEPVLIEPFGNVKIAKWFPLGKLPERAEVAHHGWCIDTARRVLETGA